jgi:hypothetical protein
MIWVSTGLRLFELKFANTLCVTGLNYSRSTELPVDRICVLRCIANKVVSEHRRTQQTNCDRNSGDRCDPPAELKLAQGNSSRKQLNTTTHKYKELMLAGHGRHRCARHSLRGSQDPGRAERLSQRTHRYGANWSPHSGRCER